MTKESQMMENKDTTQNRKGFWDSLTGFIVKLTAFIVAVTGLVALYVNRRPPTPVTPIAGMHYPIVVKLFTVNNHQELVNVKASLLSWITSHHGTIVGGGAGMDKPSIAGYAGSISVAVVCADGNGVCVVVGTGPIGLEVNDAVEAIHGG